MHSNTKANQDDVTKTKAKAATDASDASDAYWALKARTRTGVDWTDLFTDEDKFAFEILKNDGTCTCTDTEREVEKEGRMAYVLIS
jgi:hypothetical protein